MIFRAGGLAGLLVGEAQTFRDDRGFFLENFRASFEQLGLEPMVQTNLSRSSRGVLRGLHFQLGQEQAKLVSVVRGAIWDVAVDLRPHSPTFGRWESMLLDDENHRHYYIPRGFAHGFCVLSETADVLYHCSNYYSAADERGVAWNDPDLKVAWPEQQPLLSRRDAQLPLLSQLTAVDLPEAFERGSEPACPHC